MKFWQTLSFSETDQLVDLARICEEVGFDGVFLSDHVFVPEKIESRYPYSEDGAPPFTAETEWPDPWVTIGAMASVTRTLRFATAIYIAPLRHPLEVAKTVSTASILSQGRVALGVGAGWVAEEYEILGRGFRDRGRRLDEMIDVLRAVWRGGMVEYHGDAYDFGRVQMSPAPAAPIPIWVGGASAPALRRAARNDGWIGAGDDPGQVPGVMDRLRTLRAEAGLAGEPFEAIVAVTAPPSPDLFHRLEDAGVTGVISYPPVFTLGPGTSLDQKRAAFERYGDEIIAAY
jgi:probable F420-dependent oxidoreductase